MFNTEKVRMATDKMETRTSDLNGHCSVPGRMGPLGLKISLLLTLSPQLNTLGHLFKLQ